MLATSALIALLGFTGLPAHPAFGPQDPPEPQALPSVTVVGVLAEAAPDVRVNSTNENPNEPQQRVTCRRERVTGTNRWQRLCTTARQRQDLRDGAERTLGRLRDNRGLSDCEANGMCH